VIGLDFEVDLIQALREAKPPIFEPGLAELIQEGLAGGALRFTSDPSEAAAGAKLFWITYDTPVDDEDRADVDYVMDRVRRLFPLLTDGSIMLISSQVPVGTTSSLQEEYRAAHPEKQVSFAYSPENLRLVRAIASFMEPERLVVGVHGESARGTLSKLFEPFTDHIQWMSVESAEMTKHALNAFLATSVVFANEIASLCEHTGADAKQVERGLKSDSRIGMKAYLAPGAAFSGGTLARDVAFLRDLKESTQSPDNFFEAVLDSNETHKAWINRQLMAYLAQPPDEPTSVADVEKPLAGATVAVWGLTYKPGTDTLRRSLSVELCRWLASQGASVQAHDPTIQALPDDLAEIIDLSPSPLKAACGAHALVVATEWKLFRDVQADAVLEAMRGALVIDPNRFLKKTLGSAHRVQYIAVGKVNR
jgi:UDPglucose 6-dehydrogenase